jgi:2-succinyl-6-hydroxy-2,4-cyclohexadiene-1-carboxylate synthase
MTSGSPIESGRLERDGDSLYFEITGAAANPVVVLCHGAGGNHAIWFEQVPVLAQRYCVVTWDHRGFGMSTDHAQQSSPDVAVADLRALLDHLGIDAAHLVGQSMGGWTALGFALAHPERARSLVLADSLGGCPVPGWLERAPAARPDWGTHLGRHAAIGPRLHRDDPTRVYLYQLIGGFGRGTGAGIPPSVARGLGQAVHEPAALAALACPVLCIVGADDAIFPPGWVRQAAAMLGGAPVVEIPGAGHSPYFEDPVAWNAAVLSFLAGVGAGA